MPKQTPILHEKPSEVSDPAGEEAGTQPGKVVELDNLSIQMPRSPRGTPKVTIREL